MTRLAKAALVILLLILPAAAPAAEPPADQPHWSLEFKGGWFTPDIEDWEVYYGREKTWHYAGSLAYKLTRQLEVGVEGGYIKDWGQGYAPINKIITGRVTYEVAPLNVFALYRAVFSEHQWVVPYIGGGWTRIFYREQIEGQGTVRGSADGHHWRAGVQLLLDEADSRAARNLYEDFGIHNTYFFLETQNSTAMINDLFGKSINLGGTSYLMGFLFEF